MTVTGDDPCFEQIAANLADLPKVMTLVGNEGKSIEFLYYRRRNQEYLNMGGDRGRTFVQSYADKINSKEAAQDTIRVVPNLAMEIKQTNESLEALKNKDKLENSLYEDSKRLQNIAHDKLRRILGEAEKLNIQLEAKKNKLDDWSRELKEREALIEVERQNLEEEKKKIESENNSLQLASRHQKKAEQHVRQTKEALKKVMELEKQLESLQKVEVEYQELKGELEEREKANADLSQLEDLNRALIVKERQSSDELHKTRKLFITDLPELFGNRRCICIKRVGEIDDKAIHRACKKRFSADTAMVWSSTLSSSWQDDLKNSEWHPFKVRMFNKGSHEEVVDEDDEKLQNLKSEWGDDVYDAVVTALKELNEYNPVDRCVVPELWKSKEGRKATLEEIIASVVKHIKTTKRARNKSK